MISSLVPQLYLMSHSPVVNAVLPLISCCSYYVHRCISKATRHHTGWNKGLVAAAVWSSRSFLKNLKWSGRTALETSFLLRSLRSQREEVVTMLPSTQLWPRQEATAVWSLRRNFTIRFILRPLCLSVVRFVSWCFILKTVHVFLV